MRTIINLDENFKPFGDEFTELEYEKFSFPSGCEPHIKIVEKAWMLTSGHEVIITTRIKSSEDLIILLLATDALKRLGFTYIKLFIPYLPFARQDRVMVTGEPLSIKVLANIINSQQYTKVAVYDVHSEVALALINNCDAISNHNFIKKVLKDKEDYYIVSPDAGAYKKIFKAAQFVGYTGDIVLCNKIRDVKSGKILNMSCDVNDLQGKDVYIIDDICDGGGTFIGLADKLKENNAGNVNLIVSHGIFSKGIEALHNVDHIYTTNSFSDLEENDKLTQIKLDFK